MMMTAWVVMAYLRGVEGEVSVALATNFFLHAQERLPNHSPPSALLALEEEHARCSVCEKVGEREQPRDVVPRLPVVQVAHEHIEEDLERPVEEDVPAEIPRAVSARVHVTPNGDL
jgi:hypothetical protein